ncbi:O-acetylhomoserine aminocarboxypropyltransferase/cysteine synthase [Oryzomonas japonica]|uniref:O-acetylhomoserine aminocarboxypropyltransferase/cysteine synthase n=1 Tax=Oryzomonas japonica TaxID=2603858 RepID=A0A7J4ZSY9_9BACT|nr:O-acetylhomoserine aminocarboxypropyltransferase/cysteine synthase family protein [Oryzomonas japonica]KAB0666201.1 O-acetylhomoserine aminocarboxypropyltransferase/cysteine synthase [Oryzomonas japonica]
METPLRFDSLLVHGGLEPGPAGATSVPIVQSSAFAYETADALEDVFRGRAAGQVYTRLGNPTTEALERRLALLEGGGTAIATASGMAAITTTVMTIVRAGDEILASSSLFGGTFSLFRDTLANFGITARFVDPLDLESVRAAINDRTRLLFVETVGNPKLDVPDLPRLAEIAHQAGLPLIVDATVTTPYLADGAKLGADIVIHSTSKYINGSGTSIGGVIIDRGVFNWNTARFPHFEPFHKKYRQFAFTARARKLVHKDVGACAAPFNSFLLTEGIQTLALRMERHCSNALVLARFLTKHPKVAWVNYPGLEDAPGHGVATRLYGGRYGGLLTFGTGSKETAFRVINALRMAKNLANIGDAKTLVIHPASTICADYSLEDKALMGVCEDLVRVSVGIEAPQDIIDDFNQALDAI